jgi:hypothetical protein
MKTPTTTLLLSLFCSAACFAQKIPIPANYTIVDSVSGDLDKDNIPELAVVYNTRTTDGYDNKPRELIIYKAKEGKWVAWKNSRQALYGSDDGGMMGDPYEGIEIQNDVLSISQNGGSGWKWGHTDKYRYQDGDFYLIGYTDNYGRMCTEWTTVDFNLSTGKLVVKKEYQSCNGTDDEVKIDKTESETMYKKGIKITLEKRSEKEIKIVTPRYKFTIYIATKGD